MRLFFLLVFLLVSKIGYCQTDTSVTNDVASFTEEEVFFDLGYPTNIPVKDTLVHWYNYETGIILEKEGENYFCIKLDSTGKWSSKSQVQIFLTHDTAINFNSVSKDFITSVTVQHKLKTWKFGKHEAYNKAGKVIVTGAYKYDLENGTWKYFSDHGKLIKKEKWKLGVLKKVKVYNH